MDTKPKIAMLTFCVGADYKKAMAPGIESKRAYCARHGYDFHTDGEDVWDKSKPIPWSKFNFILKYLDAYDYIFWSDADVIILNQDLRLEGQVLPMLPPDRDILWTNDACNHYNNGHMLIRGRTPWIREYFRRCLEQTDLLYHIWWDNAAMIKIFETDPEVNRRMHVTKEHWMFNAYVFGPKDTANDPDVRLYRHGDFLIHFAGVYDPWNIYRMMKYAANQYRRCAPLDPKLLDTWRKAPPKNIADADASLLSL